MKIKALFLLSLALIAASLSSCTVDVPILPPTGGGGYGQPQYRPQPMPYGPVQPRFDPRLGNPYGPGYGGGRQQVQPRTVYGNGPQTYSDGQFSPRSWDEARARGWGGGY